jgi:hypothetical protein
MKFSKQWIQQCMTSAMLGLMLVPQLVSAAVVKPDAQGNCPSPALPGVLTKCTQTSFSDYLDAIMNEVLPFILFIALIMIVASGVQYMTSGFSPEAQKLAKQRIVGVLSGVIFLFLLQFVLSQLSGSISGSFKYN